MRTVRIYDLESKKLLKELAAHEDAVNAVAYSANGQWLATGSDDRAIHLWDAASGAYLASAELDTQIKSLCFSPNDRFLFTGNGNTSCYQIEVKKVLEARD